MDRAWPDKSSEWSQQDLHAYVRQMGINPEPGEIVPQGVKFIVWPQPRPTEQDIAHYRELLAQFESGDREPLAVIPRRRDTRRN